MTTEVHGFKVDLLEELGRGAFGTVYKGYNADNETVAVKKVPKADRKKASTETVKFYLMKKKINHNQIVQVIDIKSLKDDMWIFMEYCDLGDLNHFFKEHKKVVSTLDSKIKLMKQIINGIDFLHIKDIVHRDIKPANILLKKGPDQGVVVKLGDFGLSKFLDPDGQTSGMSSNVGTMIFKAPEFWDRKPDDKIRYHRNVDVYAAGLTFVAMLQTTPGQYLMPKVEGSLQRYEVTMPIGQAAFTRMVKNHPDVKITEIRPTDKTKFQEIKEIIQGMTNVSPKHRLTSSAVKTKLQKLVTMNSTKLEDLFKLRRADSTTMIFNDGCLVVRAKSSRMKFKLNIYDAETGQLRNAFPTRCNHWLSEGCLTSILDGNSLMAEGCPQCQEVSVYDLIMMDCTTFTYIKYISRLCAGPGDTTFVWGCNKIEQYKLDGNSMDPVQHLDSAYNNIHSMCYADHCDTIIVIAECPQHSDEFDIWGIEWGTGQVAWHHCRRIGSGRHAVRLDPRDLCSTPLRWVCLANGENLVILDPTDGSLVDVLSNDTLENISEVVSRKDTDNFQIAIRHGPGNPTKITSHTLKVRTDEFDITC